MNSVAVSLSQELDWLGTQAAIDAAAVGGGVVYSSGNFVYCNENSASDGSGTLVFPQASPWSVGVSWQGDYPGSVCAWPYDLGSNRFAVLCGGRINDSSAGYFNQLILTGPGCGSTLGQSTCKMYGIGTNDRRAITMSRISGFRAGINLVGGQCSHSDLTLSGNYYGYYWDSPNISQYGNMNFSRVVIDKCLLASIGVHHNTFINETIFTSCVFSTSPYSLYKETNSGSPRWKYIVAGCIFDGCQFEGFGNAVVSDDRPNQASRVVQVYNTKFKNCQYCWDTFTGSVGAYHIIGAPTYAVFDANSMFGVDIDGIWDPDQLQPGSTGIFYCSSYNGLRIRGDIATVIANCQNATALQANQFFGGNAGGPSGIVIEQTNYGNWSGNCAFSRTPATVGSVIVQASERAIEQFNLSAGSTADAPLGVLMYNPSPGSSWQNCIYASQGDGLWVNVSGSVSAGQMLRTGPNGTCVAASGSNDMASPMIGIAMSASSNGRCQIKLKGLA